MFRCFINSSISLFVLILQIPSTSLVGPNIFLNIFSLKHREFLCNTFFKDPCFITINYARRITTAEMKYMGRTAGYIWTDYITNTQIAKELKITPVLDKLLEYKRNLMQRVNRMPRNRLPRVMKHYSPTGRRNHGRLLKRLLDA